jgi:hypothetical protein
MAVAQFSSHKFKYPIAVNQAKMTNSLHNDADKAEAIAAITLQAKRISSFANDPVRSKATTPIAAFILEKELTMEVADEKIENLKEMILFSRKQVGKGAITSQTFMTMRKVQWLESQRSKAIQDIDELSDLVVEILSDKFSAGVNYEQKAQEIIDKPAVRTPKSKRRSSYKDVETLLKTISTTPLGV